MFWCSEKSQRKRKSNQNSQLEGKVDWFFLLTRISENAGATEKSNGNLLQCREFSFTAIFFPFPMIYILGELHEVLEELAHGAVGEIATEESARMRSPRGYSNVRPQAFGNWEIVQWSAVEAFFELSQQEVAKYTRNQNGRCRREMVRDDSTNSNAFSFDINSSNLPKKVFEWKSSKHCDKFPFRVLNR